MQYGSLQNLVVWKKAMRLAKDIYLISRQLPDEERYGLSDQIKRAAVSVPSNIAEGYGRMSDKEFIRFLTIANGSLYELESQLLLIADLFPELEAGCNILLLDLAEEKRLLKSLINSITQRC